jgi:hypothetical protein
MRQLNIHMTPRFERALTQFMKARGIKTKSEAVRTAGEEALQRTAPHPPVSWKDMIGIAKQYPTTPKNQWLTEDDLWETPRR